MNLKLSIDELRFYSRQIRLTNIGLSGQLKLKNAKVLVIGAGGLGCPTLTYLATAGIGTIGVLDDDHIELSNLPRQSLYRHQDVGQPKATTATRALQTLNPYIQFVEYVQRFDVSSTSLVRDYDVIVDATDNFSTKYLLNDICYQLGKPLIYAAIQGFQAQLALFDNSTLTSQVHLRSIFPIAPPIELNTSCNDAGILGSVASIVGSYQAMETVKYLLGLSSLQNHMVVFNLLDQTQYKIKLPTYIQSDTSATSLSSSSISLIDHTISAHTLELRLQQNPSAMLLIDVRNHEDHESLSLGGIPLNHPHLDQLCDVSQEIDLIVYCQTGKRSQIQAKILSQRFSAMKVYHLEGGLLGYIDSGHYTGLQGTLLS